MEAENANHIELSLDDVSVVPQTTSISNRGTVADMEGRLENLSERDTASMSLLENQEGAEDNVQPSVAENINHVANMIAARPGTRTTGSRVLQGFANLETAYFAIVNVCLAGALIADRNNQCDGHRLKQWCIVQIVLQTLMAFSNIAIAKLLPPGMAEPDRPTPRMLTAASLYSASRLFNLFWLIWAVCGIVWAFTSKTCTNSTPFVYYSTFVLAVWHLILLGLPVLLCCCSIPIVFLIYNFCPGRFGFKAPRRASKRSINKNTTTKKFNSELLSKDRASCAICLCDYVESEEVKFLRCGHHFHSECITTWLLKNKTCPFCKQDIEDKDTKLLLQLQTPTIAELPPNLA